MLESVVRTYRDRGGDVFMMQIGYRVNKVMDSTGFRNTLGFDNFLPEDQAISYLFYRVLDPAVCIYECPHRVFVECLNLPKQLYSDGIVPTEKDYLADEAVQIEPMILWEELRSQPQDFSIIDVREPREYRRGHIPNSILIPLPTILSGEYNYEGTESQRTILVCRSGRRSRRAARLLLTKNGKIEIVRGGMLAWEAAGLLQAIG